jgi:predicted esterase
MRRAVEGHVLDEMRETALVVVLQHGSGVDDEPEFSPLPRLMMGAQVVPKPVGKLSDGDCRVWLQDLREFRGRSGRRAWRLRWTWARGHLRPAGEPHTGPNRHDPYENRKSPPH